MTALSKAEGIVEGRAEAIGGIDPTALPAMYDLDPIAGDLADLSSGGVAVVGDDPALLGGTLEIEFERSTIEAPIVAVVARSTGGFEAPLYFVDRATLDASVGRLLDAQVFVDLADGAAADAEEDVSALVRDTPGSFLATREEHVASSGSEIAAFGNFIDGMLILASLIALLESPTPQRSRSMNALERSGCCERSARLAESCVESCGSRWHSCRSWRHRSVSPSQSASAGR
ncbi:hypothetical protein GCM10029992_00320 [Glycomyces albus]